MKRLTILIVASALTSIFPGFCATIDLIEDWKFSPDPEQVGIEEEWFSPDYVDEGWPSLDAGKRWEDQGFPDVDDYAWYRKSVIIPKEWEGRPVWLVIGGGNDAYDLYCNGRKVNSFGDNAEDMDVAVATEERFHTTAAITTVAELGKTVNFGKSNLLALRFYDWGGSGGPWSPPFFLTNDPEELPAVPEVKTYTDYSRSVLTVEVDLVGLGKELPDGVARVVLEDTESGGVLGDGTKPFSACSGNLVFIFPFDEFEGSKSCKLKTTVEDRGGNNLVGRPASIDLHLLGQQSWPGEYASLKVLNNFVTELGDTQIPKMKPVRLEFLNPREGWVFFSVCGVEDAPNAVLDKSPALPIFRRNPDSGDFESMQFLSEGNHELEVESAQGGRLTVRTIPEMAYTYYPCSPHIEPHGNYDWEYLERYVLPHVNTLVTAGVSSHEILESWHREGRQWLGNASLPGLSGPPPTLEEVYDVWVANIGVTSPFLKGMIVDEFIGASPEHYRVWTEAVEKLSRFPAFSEKVFYAWCGDMYRQTDRHTKGFVNTLMEKKYRFALEKYMDEEPTLEEAEKAVLEHLQYSHTKWKEAFPGWEKHLVMCLGYLSAPPESLNLDPSVDYKVFMDMQFRALATDPTFWGLYGVMEYTTSYADEEYVRWAHRLFRHYCIEGNREPLTNAPYVSDHLSNPDFAEGLSGWRIAETFQGSIGTNEMEGFSFLQGRYPRTNKGDTFLQMTRCEKGPNQVSQTIRNLEPGRAYSLKFITAAPEELDVNQTLAVTANLEGATLNKELCFQFVYPSNYAHAHGPYNRDHPAFFNYHRLVFHPNRPTVELTLSDWASPTTPGGLVEQKVAINFVEVQPFLEP